MRACPESSFLNGQCPHVVAYIVKSGYADHLSRVELLVHEAEDGLCRGTASNERAQHEEEDAPQKPQ